jgi:hypothetical protein
VVWRLTGPAAKQWATRLLSFNQAGEAGSGLEQDRDVPSGQNSLRNQSTILALGRTRHSEDGGLVRHRSAPVGVPFWVGVGADELEPVALVERGPLGVDLG